MSAKTDVRQAALAGAWYPESAAACRAAVDEYLAAPVMPGDFRGLIVPHAGFAYSGPTAGRGYRQLTPRATADLVVVFGSHRGAQGPNTVFCAEAWETPLGALSCAVDLAREVRDTLGLEEEPVLPRAADNGAELQLPFVRHVFAQAQLLMLGVAAAPIAMDIGAKVGGLCRARGRDVVFIGSTDLTHYGPNYDFVPEGVGEPAERWVRQTCDQGFLDRLLALDSRGLLAHAHSERSACCPGAVAATLAALQAFGHESKPALIDHYLSCDIRPSSSFVGYAAVAL